MRTLILAAAMLALAAPPVAAQDDSPARIDRIDRIVAIVDEDPILASDVDRVIGLGMTSAAAGAEGVAGGERRRVLDQLIEERLRFHEIDRFGFTEISLEEVDRGFEAIRQGFASQSAFATRLGELGLDAEGLRQLVARQIMVLTYVEERLGSRVFVSLDEIRQYYATTLEPEMKARGQSAPPLAEVREQIRAVLKEGRLNEEIERWTEELRQEADIEDFFDAPLDELPPHLLETLEPDTPTGRGPGTRPG